MNLSVEAGKFIAKPLYKNENWPYVHNDLYSLPIGSVGRELVEYLDQKQFKLIKGYEPHDVKHILTGYEMDTLDEVRLQFYLYGNGNKTLPVLFTLAFGICLIPEHIFTFWEDFKNGSKARSLFYIDYASLMSDNLISVRKAVNILHLPVQSRSILDLAKQLIETFLAKPLFKTI